MKAVKNNREYTITEAEKSFYQKQGFDIIGDSGEVIQYGAGKTVPYEQYADVLKELEALKEKVSTIKNGYSADIKKDDLVALISAIVEE